MFDTINKLTNKELLNEYKTYEDLIFGKNCCFSIKDVRYFNELDREMTLREEGV